ncbi:hypothetical protein [Mycobacterium hubeiense]|uniref:hypothetical protein n=1 Tax=Mycobacterium hubeiense TaxID=1867256 RepID=UPI001E39B792|nr:hypothetical protein [Mycobacterium sp. QGD 101]
MTVDWSGKNFAPPIGICAADTVNGAVSAARPVLQPDVTHTVAAAAQLRNVRRCSVGGADSDMGWRLVMR